jgi:hypothetical protein
MAVRTRLYTRESQAFSGTLTKPSIQVTHQGRNTLLTYFNLKQPLMLQTNTLDSIITSIYS